MHYVFTGFHQANEQRRFHFEAVLSDHTRLSYVVTADVSLMRKHMIGLQDGPLICLRLLEDALESPVPRQQTFTEEQMRQYAAKRSAAKEEATAARNKRPRPRPHNSVRPTDGFLSKS